ncbi:MAG: glycosyltransferase family 9 protein [Haliscomenobacter sp.]|nr:glycosyltransferase family 9 protein [Haliscomenobacter sp.]
MKPKKVLLIRFSSIGDIVLTSPVARCLKEQLGAEVHFLTKRAYRGIVDANPHIDKVHALHDSFRELIRELREEKYDAIIDLHHNLRSWKVKRGLHQAPAFAFDKLNLEKWLMVRFKINRLPKVHIVDRYLAAAAPLGVVNDGKGLDYFIPPGQEVALLDLSHQFSLEKELRELLLEGKFLAFVIGAAHATKRLPVHKIVSICRKIRLPVLLLGGLEDQQTGEAIVNAAGPHVLNGCGKFSLHQSASLVRQALQVITHDTGLMHIAAAFRKEIISIWGNTIPEFGMAPYYPEGIWANTCVQVPALPCRPCSKIGFQTCPKGHFRCMEGIDENQIAALSHGGRI